MHTWEDGTRLTPSLLLTRMFATDRHDDTLAAVGVKKVALVSLAVVAFLVVLIYGFNEVTGRNLNRVYQEFSRNLPGEEERKRFPTVAEYAKNAIPLAYKMLGAYRTGSDDAASMSYRTLARPERGLMRKKVVADRIPSTPIELKSGYFPAQPYGSAKFTVYVITYDRDKMLRSVVNHYGKSQLVDRIVISWNNIGRKPPKAESFDVPCPLHVSSRFNWFCHLSRTLTQVPCPDFFALFLN